ncbi:MAG: outer membrane beta-barrel protein [Bacteroidota bacterium]
MRRQHSLPFVSIIVFLFTTVDGFSQGYFVSVKETASFSYDSYKAVPHYKPKKYQPGDYAKLIALKASFDVAKTKYKNDYYKRKALEKADFEAILLITPDIFPNPFDVNKNENRVEQDDAATEKPRSFLSFRTGLRLSGRGDKQVDDDATYKTYIYYLALPVYALYNYQSPGGVFFGGLGPYYGYGLFGKYIDKVNGETTKEKIKFGKDESGLRHGDFGLGLVAGYVYKRILFQFSYDFGLSNIYFDKEDKAFNRAFGISVGYILN